MHDCHSRGWEWRSAAKCNTLASMQGLCGKYVHACQRTAPALPLWSVRRGDLHAHSVRYELQAAHTALSP